MNLETSRLEIPVDGGSMPAFLCRPSSDGKLPAIIVIHEIFGPTEHIDDVTCRFAGQGYVALEPDLFWRMDSLPDFSDRASFMRFRMALDDRQLLASADAAVRWLREQPFVDGEHIGIVGFCMGGYYAFLEAAHNPSLAACVDFYGAPLTFPEPSEQHPLAPMMAAHRLRVPVLGLFGEEDPSIPVEQVRELEGILQETGVPFEVFIYPGAGHAFFNDTRETYRPGPATDAWTRTLAFFERNLKS